jgi:hypothetical protein
VSLPVVGEAPAPGTTKANRTPEGEYDWEHPVEMCGPVQRLWEQGAEDRSLAIFNMVRFFAHKGLGLDELTELVIEYDRRGLGKLKGRDGPAYIKKAHEKVLATVREDGSVAPPCHSLQKLGYCKREPRARRALRPLRLRLRHREGHRGGARRRARRASWSTGSSPSSTPSRTATRRCRQVPRARREALRAQGEGPAQGRRQGATAPPKDDDERGDAESTDDAIEGEIYEDTCFYYCVTARGETKVVSSFTIKPTMRVETEDGELILGEAHTDKGGTVPALRCPLTSFHSKRDLIRQLPVGRPPVDRQRQQRAGAAARARAAPGAAEPRLEHARRLQARASTTSGSAPTAPSARTGFMDPSPVIYVPSGGSLDKRVSYVPLRRRHLPRGRETVFKHLPQVNTPEVILPILGWFFATPMKPRFMEKVGSFPSLFVWGTQGSGKSSLCIDIMWPLFGVRDAEPYSATETEFALLKLLTSTRSVPVFIDEYKPYDMQRQRLNTLHRYLRRLYRGEVEERGRPDLKVNSYHLQAPVCVAGETRPTEAALLERILTSNPEKTTLAEKPATATRTGAARRGPVLFAPRYIQFCLGRDFDADLEVRAASRRSLGERKVPVRVVENLTAMLLGVHLFEEFAKHCGCELPEDLGVPEAVDAVLDDVLETDHGVKNALDHFLEMLGVMAVQGTSSTRSTTSSTTGGSPPPRERLRRVPRALQAHRLRGRGRRPEGSCGASSWRTRSRAASSSPRASASCSTADGRRAVLIDFEKTKVVTADDFPTPEPSAAGSARASRGATATTTRSLVGVFASSAPPGAPRRRQSRSSTAAF